MDSMPDIPGEAGFESAKNDNCWAGEKCRMKNKIPVMLYHQELTNKV